MSLRNFDRNVLGLTNQPIRLVDDAQRPLLDDAGKEKFLSLKEVVVSVLTNTLEGDKSLSSVEKTALVGLAIRVTEGGLREYTVDELALIKKRADAAMLHLVHFYRLCECIEKEETPEKTEPPTGDAKPVADVSQDSSQVQK